MRPLLRAAAYVPTGTFEGARVAGPDEDLFTELVTALELVQPAAPPAGSATDVELVAPYPEGSDWAFGAVFGSDVAIVHTDADGASLAASLTAAENGSGPDCIVLVCDGPLGERAGAAVAPSGPTSDGAAAFLFREGEGETLAGFLGTTRAEPSAFRAAQELARRAGLAAREGWLGDWNFDPSAGRVVDPRQTVPYRELDTDVVSEGAYVSRARYRESLASRWNFLADRCPRCSTLTFPSRGACRACGNREGLDPFPLPREGLEVVATTVIGPGGQPTEFDPQVAAFGAYEVVLAEPVPGVRVTLQLADAEPGSVRIGDRVDTRIRRLYPLDGEWRYGRKAVPRVPS